MPDPARLTDSDLLQIKCNELLECSLRLAAADEDFRVAEGELEQLRGELTETEDRLAAYENLRAAAKLAERSLITGITDRKPALDAIRASLAALDRLDRGQP